MPANRSRKTASVRPRAAGEHRSHSNAPSQRGADGAVRLSDPAAQRDVQALVREATSSQDSARAFLREAGFLTPTGRIPKRFGG